MQWNPVFEQRHRYDLSGANVHYLRVRRGAGPGLQYVADYDHIHGDAGCDGAEHYAGFEWRPGGAALPFGGAVMPMVGGAVIRMQRSGIMRKSAIILALAAGLGMAWASSSPLDCSGTQAGSSVSGRDEVMVTCVGSDEKLISGSALAEAPCAPHTLEMLARFAVLSRLKP